MEADLRRPDRFHTGQRREEDAHRQLVGRIEQAVERVDDVLRRHRLAVVEDGGRDEIEEPGLVVLLLPRLREPGHERARFVDVDELVEDVLVDLQRRVELRVARVHVDRLVHGGHAQDPAALLRLRGRGARADGGAGGEPGGARQPLPSRQPVVRLVPVAHRSSLPWITS